MNVIEIAFGENAKAEWNRNGWRTNTITGLWTVCRADHSDGDIVWDHITKRENSPMYLIRNSQPWILILVWKRVMRWRLKVQVMKNYFYRFSWKCQLMMSKVFAIWPMSKKNCLVYCNWCAVSFLIDTFIVFNLYTLSRTEYSVMVALRHIIRSTVLIINTK